MRIIAKRTLTKFWVRHPIAEHPLRSWFDEAAVATWANPNEVKQQYGTASIISQKRIVFNIHGNAFRLIVDIEYRLSIIFIVWIGTHREYNTIDARNIRYVKTHPNRTRLR